MTHTVELPALDGRDILGFLAALGVVRLLHDEANLDVRLSYDETTAHALLHSPLATTEAVVDALVAIIDTIPPDAVIPGIPASFPLAKVGTTPDPMRMPRDRLPALVGDLTSTHTEPGLRRWIATLITDLTADAKGRATLTPYTAPAGQQSLRSFFTKPLQEIRKAPTQLIQQALTNWRRVDGYTGEYLDHRVLRSAADHPSGQSTEAGIPGATWLAIMALPLLRLTGTNNLTQATLWHHLPRQRQPIMTWPLWRQPLDPHAITALLEHPELHPQTSPTNDITINPSFWPPLGVFTVAAAKRQPIEGRKSAGVLAPAQIRAVTHR
ncbi:type I-G CRISPR-associated protein, Cas3-extension family [Micromonospora sp. WMMD737]|uniref:type I-G CRISPR-associated protein, Cas3-extension family n=1 Tax=Micromonospora sp. WMMD737 TaxID=3404113 RepID=UPI003B947CE4